MREGRGEGQRERGEREEEEEGERQTDTPRAVEYTLFAYTDDTDDLCNYSRTLIPRNDTPLMGNLVGVLDLHS